MDMLTAMKKCKPGGAIARRGYPNRKYYKNTAGLFMEAWRVDRIDFLATDWEVCAAGDGVNP